MSEIKNTESVYSVSAKTARCMDMLKKLVAVQSETISFALNDGMGDEVANDIAEPIGEAIKALGKHLDARIYERVIEGCTEI
jgi:hypothetical protein